MSGRNSVVVLAVVAVAVLLYLWMREDETPRAGRAVVETPAPETKRVKRAAPSKTRKDPKSVAVEVILRLPDDSPVPGIRVRLVEGEELARAVTDADGIARFPKVPEALLHVWAFRRELGTLSPRDGESRFVYTVKGTIDLVVRVSVAGKARLPEGFKITQPVLIDAVYDTAAAEVRGAFVPPVDSRSFFVSARAPGFASAETLASTRRPSPIKVELKLVATIKVTIDVAGPMWALGVIELEKPRVLRRDVTGKALPPGPNEWLSAARGSRTNLNKQQIRYDLGPGRYRLRLKHAPVVFHEFDVGRDSVHLSIDLTHAGGQDIRLRAPEPFDPRDARLFVGWQELSYAEPHVTINLPGDREVEVVALHPLLKRAGPLRLVQAGELVTIDLEPRNLVRFDVPPSVKGRVHARLGKEATPVARYGEKYALAADPGRYKLQVYVDGRRRHEMDIVVPQGGIDLGVLPIR